MAPWRASGLILEAPGLDFGGSGAHFPRFWTPSMEPRSPRYTKNPPNKNSITNGQTAKGGWAAVVPPGGVQFRRPPKVCEACWTTITIACQIRQDQSTKGESKRPSSLCRPRFLFPSLFLSLGAWGPVESRAKNPPSACCWASWVDFLLFPSMLQK